MLLQGHRLFCSLIFTVLQIVIFQSTLASEASKAAKLDSNVIYPTQGIIDFDSAKNGKPYIEGQSTTKIQHISHFRIYTDGPPKRLIAELNENMPTDTNLRLAVLHPLIGIGERPLSETSMNVAANITSTSPKSVRFEYIFSHTISSPPSSFSRVITLTLIEQ